MEEAKVTDETGTVPAMSRNEIEAAMMAKLQESAAPMMAEIKDEATREKAEKAIKQLQSIMAMVNMWLNAIIADVAATTVYSFQQVYDFKAFMEYQASHNVEVARRLDAMQALLRESGAKQTSDCLIRVEQKMGFFLQELKKLQPDHTIPPDKRPFKAPPAK